MARTKNKKTLLSRSPSQQQGEAASEAKEAAGGILLEKEDIQLIYKALGDITQRRRKNSCMTYWLSRLRSCLRLSI
jgi:hypothetical protein